MLAAPPIAERADLLPVEDSRAPVRVLIASLAPGGAERIVLDWLGAEAATGRPCELAVLHARRLTLPVPRRVDLRTRGAESPAAFVGALARRWRDAAAPVSTHLIGDDLLAVLWRAGVRTVPVVHNAREGWRNDPRRFAVAQVPRVLACAEAVRAELLAAGTAPPITVLRHRPGVAPAAFDAEARRRVRAAQGIGESTLLVLAIGAFKPQKDHARAVEVLARLAARRDVVLAILGGTLDAAGLAQLQAVVDAAMRLGVIERLRLPGFVDPVAPWLAAADAVLNVSRYEGLSMAVREALDAGLPVLATRVGGQAESAASGLALLPADAPASAIAARLAALPVRQALAPAARIRVPRAWSLTLSDRLPRSERTDTLIVTANLNAGGAQRSLVNLACELVTRHRFAVAVCGASTQTAFADALAASGVRAFHPAPNADPCALAESLLAWAALHGVRNLCFWNVDARVKLLVARFAPRALGLIDVSPGDYAFEELAAAAPWGEAIDATPGDFFSRLGTLVLKYRGAQAPPGVPTRVIPNGVPARLAGAGRPARPRFLVSGRVAPSKRLEVILAAFAHVRACHPDAELHVVGAAEPRHADYARGLCAAPLAAGVVWRGALPGLGFLAEPFSAAVVLGRHQGSPNAVLEALAAGIAVIANASGGTGEMVVDGRTGWLLGTDCDAPALAAAMLEALADPARTRMLGATGRDFVTAHHSMAAMAAAYLALFTAPRAEAAGRAATIDPCMWSSSVPAS